MTAGSRIDQLHTHSAEKTWLSTGGRVFADELWGLQQKLTVERFMTAWQMSTVLRVVVSVCQAVDSRLSYYAAGGWCRRLPAPAQHVTPGPCEFHSRGVSQQRSRCCNFMIGGGGAGRDTKLTSQCDTCTIIADDVDPCRPAFFMLLMGIPLTEVSEACFKSSVKCCSWQQRGRALYLIFHAPTDMKRWHKD